MNPLNFATEGSVARESVQRSQGRLRDALRDSRTGTWELDLADMRLECSDTCKANYGRSANETFTFEDVANTVHEDDRDRWQVAVRAAVEAGRDLQMEYRVRWPDGSIHWVQVRGSCTVDAAGKVVGLAGVSFDITDRRRADEALAASKERYRLLFDTIEDCYVVLRIIFDEAGRCIDYTLGEANPAFTKCTGITPEQIASGKTARELIPTLESFWFETYGNVVRTGESIRFEHRVEALNKWFEAHAFRIGGPGSNEVGVLFKDVTQRRSHEQELKLQRERQARTLETAQVATFDWDPVNDRTFGNRLLSEFFNVPQRDDGMIATERYMDSIHPDDRPAVDEAIQRSLTTGEPYEVQYRVTGVGGRQRWVLARGEAMLSPGGKPMRLSGVVLDITARVAADKALRATAEILAKSEERFRAVFEQATDDAIILMNADRTLAAWNPAAERVTGWSAAEVLGRPADLLFTPEDVTAGEAARETETANQQGKAQNERWYVRKDGSRFWGSGTMNALHDASGTVQGFLKVFRDTTARHEQSETLGFLSALTDALIGLRDPDEIINTAERMLGEHLKVARVLFAETSPDGLSVIVHHEWAPGLPSVLGTHRIADFGPGVSREFACGIPHISTNALKDYAPGAGLEAVLAIGAMSGISVPILINGALRALVVVHDRRPREWKQCEIDLMRQMAGRMFAEIERARALRAMQESERRLRLATETTNLGVFSWDLDKLEASWHNDEIYRIFGRPRELGPVSLEELLTEVIVPSQRHAFLQAQDSATGSDRFEFQCQIRRPDDRVRWIEFHARREPHVPGEPQRLIGTVADITDQKNAEAERQMLLDSERDARGEAERQGRMKDEFLATLSHELRTPLNAIVGWTQILSGSADDPETLNEGLAVIDRNVKAQTQIIEDILDMSRIISGKLRLEVSPIDLPAIVRAGVDTMQPAANAKGVQLLAKVDPVVGLVMGDANRLHQVFWNLISNAVKFTPKGGRVQVSMERSDGNVEISIADTGEGIDPAFLPHAFDRFRQADASTTRRHGGLGLGLSIVKQLVEMHGGTVRVKSPGKGMGATFVVALPVTTQAPESVIKETPAERTRSGLAPDLHREACEGLHGVDVLIVDDEPDGRAVVARLLRDCGATVRTAGSVAEAMPMLTHRPPTVLISDIGMPNEDGYSFIRRVRELPAEKGGGVPAIALTAYARMGDRIKALETGFHAHLAKPVDPAELVVTVGAMARLATRSPT